MARKGRSDKKGKFKKGTKKIFFLQIFHFHFQDREEKIHTQKLLKIILLLYINCYILGFIHNLLHPLFTYIFHSSMNSDEI